MMRVMAGSRGRASEIYGPGDGDRNLKNDRWVWLNEVPQRSALWLKQQTPEFRSYLEAFAAGINAYAKAHADKLGAETKLVLPVTALDIIQHTHHFINFEFVAIRPMQPPAPAPLLKLIRPMPQPTWTCRMAATVGPSHHRTPPVVTACC
jgi:acyl-homoserine-lactone acylase